MSRRFHYHLLDVFTDRPFAGNALAVFTEANGLAVSEMQSVAAELNLAESVFVLPSAAADHAIRIFTPGLEMRFAGHPTIGAAWAMARRRATVRLELQVGVLEARIHGSKVELDTARPELIGTLDADATAELAAALGLDRDELSDAPAVISIGTPYLVVPFTDIARLAAVDARRAVAALEVTRSDLALVAPGNSGLISDADVHVRVFTDPAVGALEDAATGSAAVPIGAFLGIAGGVRSGTHRITIEQGVEMGRPSRLEVDVDFDPNGQPSGARLAGSVVKVGEGWLKLPDR